MKKMATVTRRGNRLEVLKELALHLAKRLDDENIADKDYASLVRQYRETLKEIDEIGGDDSGDPISKIISSRENTGKSGSVR